MQSTAVGKYILSRFDTGMEKIYANALQNANEMGLTADELMAIYAYTGDFYIVFNAFKMDQAFCSRLDKLPSLKEEVFRGDLLSDQGRLDIEKNKYMTPTVLSTSDDRMEVLDIQNSEQ